MMSAGGGEKDFGRGNIDVDTVFVLRAHKLRNGEIEVAFVLQSDCDLRLAGVDRVAEDPEFDAENLLAKLSSR